MRLGVLGTAPLSLHLRLLELWTVDIEVKERTECLSMLDALWILRIRMGFRIGKEGIERTAVDEHINSTD